MTGQTKLKEQAYRSNLKSRALSVLIYLIDRSNKELTCFPAISTMAEHLHISESTVKRAIRELVEQGFIKKSERFRANRGQSSNLYTLITEMNDEAHGENQGQGETVKDSVQISAVKYITFDTLACQEMAVDEMERQDERQETAIKTELIGEVDSDFLKEKNCHLYNWTGEGVILIPP